MRREAASVDRERQDKFPLAAAVSRRSAMRLKDAAHHRQPQARSAGRRSRFLAARKAFERAIDKVVGQARPGIGNPQLGDLGLEIECDTDRAGIGIFDSIVD